MRFGWWQIRDVWLALCVTKGQPLVSFMSGNLQHGGWLRLVILQALEPDIKQQPSAGLKRSLCFYITNLLIETAIKYHCWKYSAEELTSVPLIRQPRLEEGNTSKCSAVALFNKTSKAIFWLPQFHPLDIKLCSLSLGLDSEVRIGPNVLTLF